jgi:hypothetical protein
MNDLLQVMLISLGLTVVLEVIFVLALKNRDIRLLVLIVLINILTNPPTVLIYTLLTQYGNFSPLYITLGLEMLVIFVEYRYLKSYRENMKYPLWLSIGMNVFSYTAGRIINSIFI